MVKDAGGVEVKETQLFVKMTTVEMARLYLYHHQTNFMLRDQVVIFHLTEFVLVTLMTCLRALIPM
jgi:hypothetical protein